MTGKIARLIGTPKGVWVLERPLNNRGTPGPWQLLGPKHLGSVISHMDRRRHTASVFA